MRNFSPFQEENQVIRDKSKDLGAVDKFSLEQQFHESTDYTLIVRKNWNPRPSETRSYGRQAGRQAVRRNHHSTRDFKNSLMSKLGSLRHV